ncbi:MAG: stress responsive protein [Gemmataceae bacterium]|nr:stress responsive protein [Gemmataceae bacterium]
MSSARLAHNVFFKLKDSSDANVEALVAACKKYLNVQPGIVFFAAGRLCRELAREVNDQNWDVGLHLVFDSKAAHDTYQDDPMHVRFVEENKPTWAGVRVFDSYV